MAAKQSATLLARKDPYEALLVLARKELQHMHSMLEQVREVCSLVACAASSLHLDRHCRKHWDNSLKRSTDAICSL